MKKSLFVMSVTKFIFLVTILDMIIYHVPLYKYSLSQLNIHTFGGVLTFFSVLISLFTITAFLLFLISFIKPSFVKLFTILFFITNSLAVYFVTTYSVILDKSMMGNVFNTNSIEAGSYFDIKIIFYLILFGVLPSLFVSKIKLIIQKRVRLIVFAFITLFSGVFLLYLNSTTWLWLDKNAKIIGGLAMPWSYSINAIRYKAQELKKSQKQILLPSGKFKDDNKTVVLLIIGESARAKDFSLYGYKRETNPMLKKEDILVLKNSFSTATYTTASVHSILSYQGSSSDSYEPLPSYLQRMGADVIWRTKNWGNPPLKIKSFIQAGELKKSCKGSGCEFDEVLLTNLDKEILSLKKNKIFVVLHTAGSHGPTYYKKYPKEFEVFKPVCKSVDLKECSKQELINAYDNTIVYTDYFLSKAIEKLKKLHMPSLMIYLSDHGESLGEYGLYLHGTPYSIAPDFQKKIPFMIWESKEFIKEKGFKKPFVKAEKRYTQANIFHTVLGAFGFKSKIYNQKLDLLTFK